LGSILCSDSQALHPELIATEQFVFAVEPDGEIKYVGTAKEVLKKK
jgi:hypothetical protein